MIPPGPVGYYIFRAVGRLFRPWINSDHPSVTYVGGAVMVMGWILVIGVGGYIVSLIFGN
jgi:hypothetical protein